MGYDLERYLDYFGLSSILLLSITAHNANLTKKNKKHQSFINRDLGLVHGASIIYTCTFAPALMNSD